MTIIYLLRPAVEVPRVRLILDDDVIDVRCGCGHACRWRPKEKPKASCPNCGLTWVVE